MILLKNDLSSFASNLHSVATYFPSTRCRSRNFTAVALFLSLSTEAILCLTNMQVSQIENLEA